MASFVYSFYVTSLRYWHHFFLNFLSLEFMRGLLLPPSLPPFSPSFPFCTWLLSTQCHPYPLPNSLLPLRVEAAKLNLSELLFQQHSGLDSAQKKCCPKLRQKEGKAIFLWGFLQAGMWADSRKIYSSFWESSCKSPALVLQSGEIIRSFPWFLLI